MEQPFVGSPWLEELLSFDTTSSKSNLGLIERVRDFLAGHHLQTYLTYDKTACKANLFATIPGQRSETDGGLILSGHTDVVPVEGQDWSSDPFRASVRDGRIYGRGSCDMKGFIGVALDLVPYMVNANLAQPIHLALSFDEEPGCAGVPYLLEDLERRDIKPRGCVVGEPTSMDVVVAHKGINAYRCKVRGKAAHSSLQPTGVNAIEYAARLIERIRQQASAHVAEGPFDDLFDVPFLTAQTGMIRGGIAMNTIPAECEFQFEFRNLPVDSSEKFIANLESFIATELLPAMLKVSPEAGIELERLAYAPPLETSEDEPLVKLVRSLLNCESRRRVAYATEAGLFQRSKIPTLVCGPGDIAQAHKADEFVAVDQIEKCSQFLRRLIAS